MRWIWGSSSTTRTRPWVPGSVRSIGGRVTFLNERQRKPKLRAAGRRADADASAVRLNDRFTDRQPQTRSPDRSVAGGPVELSEDALLIPCIQTRALIAEEKPCHARRPVPAGPWRLGGKRRRAD